MASLLPAPFEKCPRARIVGHGAVGAPRCQPGDNMEPGAPAPREDRTMAGRDRGEPPVKRPTRHGDRIGRGGCLPRGRPPRRAWSRPLTEICAPSRPSQHEERYSSNAECQQSLTSCFPTHYHRSARIVSALGRRFPRHVSQPGAMHCRGRDEPARAAIRKSCNTAAKPRGTADLATEEHPVPRAAARPQCPSSPPGLKMAKKASAKLGGLPSSPSVSVRSGRCPSWKAVRKPAPHTAEG